MNKEQEIKVENLSRAALRYYSEKDNGIECSENLSEVFLVKISEGVYINPFNPLEMYPVFRRAPYANVLMPSGEDYGFKVWLVGGTEQTGPCYVLSSDRTGLIFKREKVTVGELEDYILSSGKYFKDRKGIALERIRKNPIQMLRVIKKDEDAEKKMLDFFEERRVHVQKVR